MTAREELIESYRIAADVEAAIINKVRNEFSNVIYEPATLYAAGYVIYHVQQSFTPEQKDTVIDFATLFKISKANHKAKQKWLRDSLGDNMSKLNDLFFVYPLEAVSDFLNSRGRNAAREAIPV